MAMEWHDHGSHWPPENQNPGRSAQQLLRGPRGRTARASGSTATPAEGPRPEKLPGGAPEGLPHGEGDFIPETCAPLISLSNLMNSSILK